MSTYGANTSIKVAANINMTFTIGLNVVNEIQYTVPANSYVIITHIYTYASAFIRINGTQISYPTDVQDIDPISCPGGMRLGPGTTIGFTRSGAALTNRRMMGILFTNTP